MEYTLFVDESGTFGHERGDDAWVVGGLVVPGTRRKSENRIGNVLGPIPSRFGLDRKDLHCTELRKKIHTSGSDWSHARIADLSTALFKEVRKEEPKARLLAVRNTSGRGLIDPERTYRLTLLDLIALTDATLPAGHRIEKLHLCVATRTRDGERMSSDEELVDRLKSAYSALEVDLASRGLQGIIGRLYTETQAKSWLLTVADFWCNQVYNMEHAESGAIVERVEQMSMGRVYRTWSERPEIRRALVAERDGNDGLALYRWAILDARDDSDENIRTEAIERLCRRLLLGGRDPSFTFEQTIEMLWSNHGLLSQYEAFSTALERIIVGIQSVTSPKHLPAPFLFRMRNMLHLAANRHGETDRAKEIGQIQKEREADIAHDPDRLDATLTSHVARIHTLHHDFQFEHALDEAQKHRERVGMYGDLLELIEDDASEAEGGTRATQSFAASKMSLRADMTWLQSVAYASCMTSSPLQEALDHAATLAKLDLGPEDASRLCNYRILLLLRIGQLEDALAMARQALDVHRDDKDQINPFILQYSVRTAATCALTNVSLHRDGVTSILEATRSSVESIRDRYPLAFILRDLAVLEYVAAEDPSTARKHLQSGREQLSWFDSASLNMIRTWIKYTFDLTGRYVAQGENLDIDIPEPFRHLFSAHRSLSGREGLTHVRYVSPY